MDCETMAAVRNVVEYLRDDEQKSYEEQTSDEQEAGEKHIYLDVLKLEAYLDNDA